MLPVRANLRLAVPIVCLLLAATAEAQPYHRIHNDRNRFWIEALTTRTARPYDLWVTRLANALMDRAMTDEVIANLDDYLRYGVNTLEVCVQGGELGYGKNGLYPAAYRADGTLDPASVVWTHLERLLAETDRRGMVLIVQFWHQLRDQNVPDDARAVDATRNTAEWLRKTGRRNYLVDVANEFDHGGFEIPGQKGVRRPLFSTLEGALTLLEAVYDGDPDVIAGVSPTGALLCPEGYLDNLPRGKRWVEARMIIGHNQVADPMNPFSYKLGSVPRDPASKPYVNTEFNLQLRYEKDVRPDPRTLALTYGHWDAATVALYLTDLRLVRAYGGYTNVFSHHQQYAAPTAVRPVAAVGPEGTQPESTPGGEPSMHWLFTAIARETGRLPLPRLDDFNAGASGLELDTGGTWDLEGGRLRQTDDRADPAWARTTAPEGDLEISFEAGFLGAPGVEGRLGIQLGAPTPAGPAYRLLVGADRVILDQVGGPMAARTVLLAKRPTSQYVLRLSRGRAAVLVDGLPVAEVPDPGPLAGRNLLFVTGKAAAAFDNLRVSPIRETDFQDGTAGDWHAIEPAAWNVVPETGMPTNKVWEGIAPASAERQAVLDRNYEDLAFALDVDLSGADSVGVGLRTADTGGGGGAGYYVYLTRGGDVSLERRPASGPAVPLAATRVEIQPAATSLRVVAEGPRIRCHVDGKVVIDVRDEAPDAPVRGGLVIRVASGTARFDDFRLTVAPNRAPVVRFDPGTGPPLPAGFAIDYTDPDGLGELVDFKFELDTGGNVFVDITWLLLPVFGAFRLEYSPDGKGVRLLLNGAVPLGSLRWTLRASARDREGNTGRASYATGS
jgi:hypothetical protein